jgi:hypothetical protein
MLEALFGNESIERVLFYLLQNKTCYALQLKKQFQLSSLAYATGPTTTGEGWYSCE